ncbi:hypothetical protein [Amycolatopsis sp. NPDC059021]|uniref:hypothetical protein n=1 Tax=Amycolatopsis sp. NPDC059021 TaxID=3346704 RepID=UPI0036725253
MPWVKRRWVIAAGVAILVVVAALTYLVTGDSAGTSPRALTPDEVSRLAITRFRNHEARGRAVTITVPDPAGALVVTGSVDYRAKIGYGVVKGKGRNDSGNGLVQWTTHSLALHPMADTPGQAPDVPPATGWYRRPLATAGGALDRALAIVLGLGSDRPDNAQLLPQNGAAWVGTDQIGGHAVDIFTGPESRERPGTADSVRYWLDANGVMYRAQAAVPAEPEPVVIDFDTGKYTVVPPIPGLTSGG